MHSWRAEQLASRMNTLPQDYWELGRELESTSRGGKIILHHFYIGADKFQMKQKLKISRDCLVFLGAKF